MQQRALNQAVARLTGESLRTIRHRGFGLLKIRRDFQYPPTVTRPTKSEFRNRPASEA